MNTLKRNESGFSAVELILIVVVIAVLGGVGWLVYKHYRKAPPATTTTAVTKSSPTSAPKAVDPYDGWTTVTTTDKAISVKIPATWVSKTCDSPKIVYVAPTTKDLATCSSGNGGTASISYGDLTSSTIKTQETTKSACDKTFAVTQPTINNVQGYRVERVETASSDDCVINFEGTKYVSYYFDKNAKSYNFTYKQTSTANDDLATFDLIVKSASF